MEPISQAQQAPTRNTSQMERLTTSPTPAKYIWGQLSPGQQQIVFRTLVSIGNMVINEISQHQAETKNE